MNTVISLTIFMCIGANSAKINIENNIGSETKPGKLGSQYRVLWSPGHVVSLWILISLGCGGWAEIG